jgi:iron complex outermembrane receptor protein
MQQPAYNLQAAMVPGVDPFLPPYSPTTCDGYQFQVRNQEDLSLQVQLTSDDDSEFRWQVGAYYLNIEREVGVAQLEDDGRTNLPQSLINELTDALVYDDFTTDVYSIFGSINYDINDRTELSFALRYDKEEREVENLVPSPAQGGLSQSIDWCPSQFENGCTLNGEPLNGTPWNPGATQLAVIFLSPISNASDLVNEIIAPLADV